MFLGTLLALPELLGLAEVPSFYDSLFRSSEFLASVLGPSCYHSVVVLLWDRLLVQSFVPNAVSPLLVLRFHFAVSLFLGFVVFPH
jgi:hypothetical protein